MSHTPKRLTRVLSAMAIAVGLGAGAAGIAAATTSGSSSPAQQVDEPQSGPDQDNVDFTPPGENAESPDQPGEANESEAEPANDPEPNHEDPDGVNVDHTPAGEAPEPEAPGAQG